MLGEKVALRLANSFNAWARASKVTDILHSVTSKVETVRAGRFSSGWNYEQELHGKRYRYMNYKKTSTPLSILACWNVVVFACVLQLITPVSADSLTQSDLCPAIYAKLDSSYPYAKPLESDYSGCTLVERVIVFSNTWPQYVANFAEYMETSGFPYLIHKSFVEFDRSMGASSLRHSELALENALQFFERSNDPIRKSVYTHFIGAWIIENSPTVPETREQFSLSDKASSSLSYLKDLDRSSRQILICLLISDPFLADFQVIANSHHFKSCITLEAENE
ncbi:MAG: hypothetical protein AAGI36_13865 [Pseudomonadota bacterium]